MTAWPLMLAGILAFSTGVAFGQETPAPSIGTLVFVQGRVWAKQKGSADRNLLAGSKLFQGDDLITAKDSSAKVILGGTIGLLIKSNTDLELVGRPKGAWTVKLNQGAVLSVVHNPLKRPDFFRLKSRAVTMGVRGTVFFAQVTQLPNQPLFFCPCHGEIDLESADSKSNLDVKSEHHDTPSLISDGNQPLQDRVRPVPKAFEANHSDVEISDLEKIISN